MVKATSKKQKLLKVPNSFTTKHAISPYKNIPFFYGIIKIYNEKL